MATTHANPFITVASTVVIAQAAMIGAALAATKIAQHRGYWAAILIVFTALPIRGLIAAGVITICGVIPVQVLDGIGAGMLSVAPQSVDSSPNSGDSEQLSYSSVYCLAAH